MSAADISWPVTGYRCYAFSTGVIASGCDIGGPDGQEFRSQTGYAGLENRNDGLLYLE